MDAQKLEELQQMASRYFDGDLDEAGLEQLTQLLADDPEATTAYVNLVTTHTDLMLLRSFAAPSESRLSLEENDGQVSVKSSEQKVWRRSERNWIGYGLVGLATSLVTLITYQMLLSSSGLFDPGNQPVADIATKNDRSIAHIVRKVDCDWEGNRWSVVSSNRLHPGQTVTIGRGLMELEFTSGARVTLEAPVSFTVESAMRAVLSYGKLTAQVPESAHGFTVGAPAGEAVDLGTKFGLFVGKNGVTETHVFEGEVVVRHGKPDKKLHLTDDMAVRLGGNQINPESLNAVPARFTRLDFEKDEVVAVPAVDRKLLLWLSADRELQKDESGRVASWGDLRTTSNQTAQNAWQVEQAKRPRWIDDAIGGQPAVRFASKTLMTTEPLELGSAQSVAVVFRINQKLLDHWGIGDYGRQLVNLNGPPHLVLRVNKEWQLNSQNYTGFRTNDEGKREYMNVGKTTNPAKLDEKPVVAVSVYDPPTNSSRLYVNGVMVDQAKAPKTKPTKSPRYIGSHMFLPGTHFFGDISELMVYDTGLTDQEALALSKSLLDKYKLTPPPIKK